MRILLVKTSSLGDVIHNLPVVNDIRRHVPAAMIDWCVEEAFADVPRLHPGVVEVLPVALRRWRKGLLSSGTWREAGAMRSRVKARAYDAVIDTQGLVKSAVIARQARGPLSGYAADAAREPMAARFYDRRFSVSRALHAVDRNRRLVAAALGYEVHGVPDYGIAAPADPLPWLPTGPYAVLMTATSRDDKLWPEAGWIELGQALHGQGWRAILPGGSPRERERAGRLAAAIPGALAAPPLHLPELATLLGGSRAAIGVDTGLTHLAVALGVPTVALYTATDPGLTGVLGAGFHRNLGGKGQVPTVAAVVSELLAGAG
jgi:heptosyltransferase-1